MKLKSLLASIALGAISVAGLASAAKAEIGLYIDTGDYWRNHQRDYCYYHDCGDRWYVRHHRHRWHDRDWWREGRDHGWNNRGWYEGGGRERYNHDNERRDRGRHDGDRHDDGNRDGGNHDGGGNHDRGGHRRDH